MDRIRMSNRYYEKTSIAEIYSVVLWYCWESQTEPKSHEVMKRIFSPVKRTFCLKKKIFEYL